MAKKNKVDFIEDVRDDENANYYEDVKKELMTKDEIELTERYKEWFRASWEDTEARGLFDKWEMADIYWEGDSNLSESDDDPASNTNIINSAVEGMVALTVDRDIAIMVQGREPSDIPFNEHVQTIGQFILDKNKMRPKVEMAVRRMKKYGTAIMTVLFNPDLLDGMGLPEFKCWNPAYVFIDPNITNVYEYNNARYIIIIANKSIHWAKEAFGDEHAKAIKPMYHPIETEWLFGEEEGTANPEAAQNYLHMFVFTKLKGKVRLVQMSSCGVILWDSLAENVVFPDNQYPVFLAPDMPREGTTKGKASVELLWNTQDLINDLDDQIRWNARLSGNIQKVVNTSSGIDIDKWTNEMGLNIPANDHTGFQIVKPPEMPQYIIQRRREAITSERQIQSRFSDQMFGVRQSGVDTATEALALHQQGIVGVDHDKAVIEFMLGCAMEYALELAKDNWTEEHAFRITNKENEFLWYRTSKLKAVPKLIPATEDYRRRFAKANPNSPIPQYMIATGEDKKDLKKNAMFDIKITIGSGIPVNKAFQYQVVKEAYQMGAMSIPEYRHRLRELGVLQENSFEQEQQIVAQLEQVKQKEPQAKGQNAEVQGMSAQNRPQLQESGTYANAI
jgi:hypothetical protein